MFEHRPRHLSVAAATTNEGERSRLGRGLATAVVAGLAWTVSLPPFGWWFLAPVAVALRPWPATGNPWHDDSSLGWSPAAWCLV